MYPGEKAKSVASLTDSEGNPLQFGPGWFIQIDREHRTVKLVNPEFRMKSVFWPHGDDKIQLNTEEIDCFSIALMIAGSHGLQPDNDFLEESGDIIRYRVVE